MADNQKKKIEMNIAGVLFPVITDESEVFVRSIEKLLDEKMGEIISSGMNCSRLDAALMCAVEFCGDKLTAEKKMRNLEAQVSLYEVTLKRMKEELALLRQGEVEKAEQISSGEEIKDDSDGQLHMSFESEKKETENKSETDNPSLTREDRLKLIEDLFNRH